MISWTRPPYLLRKIYSNCIWKCWLRQDLLFSFDDGPGPFTNSLLDLSLKYDIKFVFFVLPEQANKYPQTIFRIVNEGHILGSHFMNHSDHLFYSKTSFLHSLDQSIKKIEEVSNNKVKYCRVPYGHLFPWQQKWIQVCYFHNILILNVSFN